MQSQRYAVRLSAPLWRRQKQEISLHAQSIVYRLILSHTTHVLLLYIVSNSWTLDVSITPRRDSMTIFERRLATSLRPTVLVPFFPHHDSKVSKTILYAGESPDGCSPVNLVWKIFSPMSPCQCPWSSMAHGAVAGVTRVRMIKIWKLQNTVVP